MWPFLIRCLGAWSLVIIILPPGDCEAQQVGDTTFNPALDNPSFPAGEGPRVFIDEAHVNFHTLSGRFGPFARLLRADGFVVEPSGQKLTSATLTEVDLLVVANALAPRNETDWGLPTPSAFSSEEISVLRSWVEDGGALLVIADHMPFPGAAKDLAATFGFEVNNGFAVDTTDPGTLVFRRSDGSLGDHPVTWGRSVDERVDSVASFTGQAFRSPPGATVLMRIPKGVVSLMPRVAWEFEPETTEIVEVGGWSQGAVLELGRGRIGFFGEAAMFTAQRAGPEGAPMGMNAPVATQNAQFVINLVRWLTRAGSVGLPASPSSTRPEALIGLPPHPSSGQPRGGILQ